MRKHAIWLSAMLALAAPSTGSAMPSTGVTAGAAAHAATAPDARVAIILQRKPAERKPPAPKKGK